MKSKTFLLAVLAVLFTCSIASAQVEEITLSTYYPAPYGDYDELAAEKLFADKVIIGNMDVDGDGDYSDSDDIALVNGGNMLIEGKVGIGTTAPGSQLHISGPGSPGFTITDTDGGGGRPYIRFTGNNLNVIQSDDTGTEYFGIYSRFSSSRSNDAVVRIFGDTGGGTTWGRYLQLTHNGADGVISTDTGDIAINPAGNVGIGTTGPEYGKLDIVGPYGKTDTTLRNVLRLRTNDASNPFDLKMSVIGAAALTDRTFTLQTSDHLLSNNGNVALQPYGGNVGIGTTSPGEKLTVAGIIESTTGGVKFPDGSIQTTAAPSILHTSANGWSCSINLPDGTWLLQVHAAFQQHCQNVAYLRVDGTTIQTTSNVGDPPGVEQITMFGAITVSGGTHTATIQADYIWSNGSPRIMIIAFKTAS